MKYLLSFNINESYDYLRAMYSFGVTKEDIDENGYITLYHGGKHLPEKLKKGEIFFMTPNEETAKEYAEMRNGSVFILKIKPEDVN